MIFIKKKMIVTGGINPKSCKSITMNITTGSNDAFQII